MISPTKRRGGKWLASVVLALLPTVASMSAHVGAAAAQQASPAFETLTSQQLAQKLSHKDFTLINVHIPYEGEIEQTDAFIPFDEVTAHLAELPTDKDASIVLYCRSGRMSEIAATALAALGYTRVSHLSGGMNAWAEFGRGLIHE